MNAETPAANTNGTTPPAPPLDPRDVLQRLTGEPLSQGYRPTLPMWALWTTDTVPQFYLLRDIELMMIHPVVRNGLGYFKGGIAGAEFDGGLMEDGSPKPFCEESPEANQFITEQIQKYWDVGVPMLQGGYEYGWIAGENLFSDRDGPLSWEGLIQFSPRDTFLLTQDSKPVGVRVKQIRGQPGSPEYHPSTGGRREGSVDLWMATDDVPAKGLWYAHNPRYNQWFGQSQLLGAWRPWRRLAWKDGAETVTDGGIYRFAYSGPVVSYPEEDLQTAVPGAPQTTLDGMGRPRRFARDMARQIAEQYKAGAGVGIPSSHYPPDLGGGEKWKVQIPQSTLNVGGLIEYVKYLIEQVLYGIGIPPELLQASETGSGYSGRAIPLEGFIMLQQRLANNFLKLFVDQVLRPLVRWNFGPVKWNAKVSDLLNSKRKQQVGERGQSGQQLQGEQRQQGPATPPPAPSRSDAAPAPQQENVQWYPHQDPQGKVGWRSQGGRVLYGASPPGSTPLSLTDVPDRVRYLAAEILRRRRVA